MEALAARRQHLTREAEEARAAMGNRTYKVTLVRAAFSWLKEQLMHRWLEGPLESQRDECCINWSELDVKKDAEAFIDWLQKGAPRGEG